MIGQFVGLGPVEIILSLLLGAKLGGVVGLFIAIPVAGVIRSTIDSLKLELDQDASEAPDASVLNVLNPASPPASIPVSPPSLTPNE